MVVGAADGVAAGNGTVVSAPLLEEPHALAATIGAPKVASTRRRMTTVPWSVVAIAATPNTRTPENVDQRRSSETISSNTNLSFCPCDRTF